MSDNVLNLDRAERQRRNHDIDQFDQLSAFYVQHAAEGTDTRPLLLQEWKKRRLENWQMAFASLPAEHSPPVDLSELESKRGLRFEGTHTIASGLFSNVLAGIRTDRVHKQSVDVAVKVLRKRDFGRQFAIQNMERQMSILLRLTNANLVRVLDVIDVSHTHQFMIVMQRAQMGSLESVVRTVGRVREQPLGRKWTRDILFATDYLHNIGLAHRRIHPMHVLLHSPNHAAKLAAPDAFAEVRADAKNTGSVRNEFAAPEVNFGTVYDALPADIWSLGCTVFFMLTTRVPFKDHTILTRVRQQLDDKNWKQDPDLSPDAIDFLSNLLHGSTDKRHTTTELLFHPWLVALTTARSRVPKTSGQSSSDSSAGSSTSSSASSSSSASGSEASGTEPTTTRTSSLTDSLRAFLK